MSEKLLCVANVAKRLDCSRRYVYTLIQCGKLKAVRIGEKHGLRVPESSLVNFIAVREVKDELLDWILVCNHHFEFDLCNPCLK